MKNKIILFGMIMLLLGGSFFLSGCGRQNNKTAENGGRLQVAATIFPLYDIVRQVGGDKIDPVLILPPGASPHTFEVSPDQIKAIQGARVLFAIGGDADAWVRDIANAVTGANIISLDGNIDLKPFGSGGNHVSLDSSGGDNDPHYWLDPDNAEIMAQTVAENLSELNQANRNYYEARARTFISDLNARDAAWRAKLAGLHKKDIVVFHDAWGYFADHFGLKIAGTFEPFPGQEPSPQYLQKLEETIRRDDISTIFVEPQLSEGAISSLAGDLGVKIGTLDPIGGVAGRDSYQQLIDYDVNQIYVALRN